MSNKAINIQQPERVLLFDGEEDFVISRGGKNNQYLMIEGVTNGTGTIGKPQSATNCITDLAGNQICDGKQPITGLVFEVPNWGTLNCNDLQTQITNLTSYLSLTRDLSADQRNYYESQLAIAKGTYAQKCTTLQPPPIDPSLLQPPTPPPTPTPTPPSYTIPDFSSMSCDTLKLELEKLEFWFSANQSKLDVAGISDYGNAIKNGKTLYTQKCSTPQYPKFDVPNWATLSCESLKTKIDELDKYFNEYSSKFTSLDRMFYDGSLTNGKSIYDSKCKSTTPPPTPTPTTTVTSTTSFIPSLGTGGFFGGGRIGGGSPNLGQKPTLDNKEKVIEKKKSLKNYWWILLLLGVAGYIYYKNKENKAK